MKLREILYIFLNLIPVLPPTPFHLDPSLYFIACSYFSNCNYRVWTS